MFVRKNSKSLLLNATKVFDKLKDDLKSVVTAAKSEISDSTKRYEKETKEYEKVTAEFKVKGELHTSEVTEANTTIKEAEAVMSSLDKLFGKGVENG